ncbi:MAG: DUF4139 domain-containing protein, partial [Planctomycetes bacterium]|nr:DUF4139 domain-containing protein [Planctomycetota bacterium]
YARGAVVTRKVELPAGLPNESVDLHVGGITPMAEPGSVRTSVDGERGITGLTAPLVWPETKQPTPPDQAAIKAKQRELRRNQQRQNRLRHRLQLLEGIGLSADLQAQKPRHDEEVVGINERLGAATETSDMIHELLTRIDAELRELARSEEKLDEELFNLQRHSKPAPSGEQKREVRITLAPGSDHLRALEISYNVSAARWWPAYAARLSDGGRNAEFAVEAFVAQQTLEDWKDAEISLCTADMISDLTLPELQSLRLGRKQPPKRSGFREPPEGLDALFKGHDEAFGGPGEVFKRAEPLPPPMPKSAPAPVQAQAVASEVAFAVGAAAPEDYDDEMLSDIGEGGEAAESEEYVMLDVDENRFGSQRRSPDEKAKKAGAPMRSRGIGAAASAPGAAGGAMAFDMADAMPAEEPEPETTGVDEQWLDFDSLELAPNTTDRRGRLVHGRSNRYGQAGNLANAIDSLSAPGNSSDPLYSRGQFDHRFDADGLVEISCSGVPQRVRLLAKSAKS